VHLLGFITKKFVKMHGHMNVKYCFLFIYLLIYLFIQRFTLGLWNYMSCI